MRNQTHYNSAQTWDKIVKSNIYMQVASALNKTCLTSDQKKAVDAVLKTGATDIRVIANKI